jgi:hypothetical protein
MTQPNCNVINNFTDAILAKKIWLNEDLIKTECSRQAQLLAQHYQNLSVVMQGRSVCLPARYMGDPQLNPFKGYEKTEISVKTKQFEVDEITNEKIMVVIEKHSGKKILFKTVPQEISKLYSLGFSNLHYARDGEANIYGAYLEGDQLPFTYSAYNYITRNYTQDMLRYLGFNPNNIVESSRAWNASWAPENTMSVLFTFSHEMMKEGRERQINDGTQLDKLDGVLASINPNLGFKAVSFRGVRFNIAAIKPTIFSYLKDDFDRPKFMPKGEIMKTLSIADQETLDQHPLYTKNKIPFLPTLEMLCLFDIEKEKKLLNRPVYNTTMEAYLGN